MCRSGQVGCAASMGVVKFTWGVSIAYGRGVRDRGRIVLTVYVVRNGI